MIAIATPLTPFDLDPLPLRRPPQCPLIVAILPQELLEVWRQFHLANIGYAGKIARRSAALSSTLKESVDLRVIAHERQNS
jgi:hypothetical protein